MNAGPHCVVVAASRGDGMPMPPRGFELVGWRLICASRMLVSAKACPDVAMAVKMRACVTVCVPVKVCAYP